MTADPLAADAPLAAALGAERARQESYVELIASENYVSPRVLLAQGSVLTNKYADGYPGRRFYSGCQHVDAVELLAIERACALFGAAHANVQPYSGSQANVAAFLALASPGDTLLAMAPAAGGHRTHGAADNITGQIFKVVHYGVDPVSGEIDYDEVARHARAVRPRVVVAGFSAYSRIVDWERFRAIADDVGAALVADMAHVAGLVAAGLYPNPVPLADVTTTTTHKTLRGPRGGLILTRDRALGERVDAAVYPGTQGGPLTHVIAAKAAAFGEAMRPEFKAYQRAVIANAQWLAEGLKRRGYAVVTGGTDNHMLLVDLGQRGGRERYGPSTEDGATAEAALERAHIAVNKITVPGQPADAPPRGLRLGTPAVTTRGLGIAEMDRITGWIGDVLDSPDDLEVTEDVRAGALELCGRYPVYG